MFPISLPRIAMRSPICAPAAPRRRSIAVTVTVFSVLEVIESVKRVSGVDFKVEFTGRREGDPTQIVAACDRVRATLNWQPRLNDLDTIVGHALAWERKLSKRTI